MRGGENMSQACGNHPTGCREHESLTTSVAMMCVIRGLIILMGWKYNSIRTILFPWSGFLENASKYQEKKFKYVTQEDMKYINVIL